MKIYCKQVRPDWQESPLFRDEFPDNIAVFGNNRYKSHIPDDVARVRAVLHNGELADRLETHGGEWYKNCTDAINDYLPPVTGRKYSTRAIHALRYLVADYASAPASDELGIMCRVLSIVTGKAWEYSIIRGSCQGDWQNIVYPVDDWTPDALAGFECMYFNTGTEWIVHDETEPPAGPDDIAGYSVYCVGWSIDQIRAELADCTGAAPDDLVLYEFTGFTQIPVYSEV